MKTETKFVYFSLYCPKCKHWDNLATEDPCNECLTSHTNVDSRKPVNFEEKVK